MTSMLPHRRRAAELADAIEGRRPARTAEVRELVAVAAAMQATPAVVPRADFAAELRAELVAAAHRELSLPPSGDPASRATRPQRSRYRRMGLAAATGAFVVVGGTTGIASASADALPGDLLYPVKRGVEQIDLALTTDPTERGRLELELADTRLEEVSLLLESDDPVAEALVAETLADFTESAGNGSDLLFESQDASERAEAAALVNGFAVESSLTLNVLAAELAGVPQPVDAVRAFSGAAEMMASIDAAATSACPTCLEDEDSVSVTDPGGGEPPVLNVIDSDGDLVVTGAMPDSGAVSGSAGPAVGSGSVPPQAAGGAGGSAGYLPPVADLPRTTSEPAPGAGGSATVYPPPIGVPPTVVTPAPTTVPPSVEPGGTTSQAPTAPTAPQETTPPTTDPLAPGQTPTTGEPPATTADPDSEADSDAPEADGDVFSEPAPELEPAPSAEPTPDSSTESAPPTDSDDNAEPGPDTTQTPDPSGAGDVPPLAVS
jgi:hypothetical protein